MLEEHIRCGAVGVLYRPGALCALIGPLHMIRWRHEFTRMRPKVGEGSAEEANRPQGEDVLAMTGQAGRPARRDARFGVA